MSNEFNTDRDSKRIKEAFIGWLADQASVDIREAYERYVAVADKYADNSYLAFPPFVDAVASLPYVKYDNSTGDIHFLLDMKNKSIGQQ